MNAADVSPLQGSVYVMQLLFTQVNLDNEDTELATNWDSMAFFTFIQCNITVN